MNARSVSVAALMLALSVGVAVSEEPKPRYDMTTYQLALFVRGPDWKPMGERELVALQEGHLALLQRLLDDGKLIVSGPVVGGGELREIVVIDAPSPEAAREILEKDPWVKAGRLALQIHPWWTARGILRTPESLHHMEPSFLGLLKRPPAAPEYDEAKLREIQAGHMANIEAMAAEGDLVLAGPMGDDGVLRGIFIFRTMDAERLREMVARDPAVKAGRLGVELYPWHLPKGTLPQP